MPSSSDLVGVGRGLRIRFSHKFAGAAAAGLGITLEEPLPYTSATTHWDHLGELYKLSRPAPTYRVSDLIGQGCGPRHL